MTKKGIKPFIHVHNHSKYSFKDGHATFEDMLAVAEENNQPAIAITDHGFMYNAIDFYLKAKKTNIKPIIGCEVYVMAEGKSIGLPKSEDPSEESNKKEKTVDYFHLLLLVKDEVGLENLHTLCSIGNNAFDDEHFYYRPRIKRSDLKKYHEGLICCSACIGGEIPMLLLHGKDSYAKSVAKWYRDLFKDDYYLEIQDHGIKREQKAYDKIIELAESIDVPLVLTNDCHYARKENYKDHKLLKCISYKEKYKNAINYDKYFPSDDFYIKSSEEMYSIAKKFGDAGIQAYNNTYEIYEKCNLEIDTSLHFPKSDISGYNSAFDKLNSLIFELLPEKYPIDTFDEDKKKQVYDRIEKELYDIKLGRFEHYFLMVYEIVKYSKDNGILIGCGRGSGAASIVANILNITDIEPLTFDLIFERFWNPGRCVFAYKDKKDKDYKVVKIIRRIEKDLYEVCFEDEPNDSFEVYDDDLKILKSSAPDIDIDIPSDRRDEVIEFCKQKWGFGSVCSCGTFGTYNGRNLVRAGCEALDLDESMSKTILSCFPFKGSESLSGLLSYNKELQKLYGKKEYKDVIDRMLKLEGCCTNSSTHAGGVVITDGSMYKFTPVFKGKNGLTSQYPYETLEAIGCLKIDLLGHKAEQIIDNACTLIKENHGIDINPYQIPMYDKKTFQLFKDCRMNGIPQLQSDWHIPILQDVMSRPIDELSIEDIIALVTMIRPGSLDSGQTDRYRRACMGEDVSADVPELEPIVEAYKYCLLYQEQIMKIATDIGNFAMDQADALRKVCAKTKYQHLAEPLLKDLERDMLENNVSQKNANKILDIVRAFFAYSFNKAHAAGYGVTTYRVAYLKANYFLELTTAQLNGCIGDQETTKKFLDEVIEQGYNILYPDVNRSNVEWTCEKDGIRIPFGAIDGIGESCAYAIVEERELKGDYKSFEDFVYRLPGRTVKKGAIENLILLSAFKSLGYEHNKFLHSQYEDIVDRIRENAKALKGKSLFGSAKETQKQLGVEYEDVKGEFPIKEIQEDEEYLLGFKITMSEDEKRILLKKLKRRSDKLKSKEDVAPKKKKSAKEKLKAKMSTNKNKEVEVVDEKESEESNSIKNSLKNKLNIKQKANKESEVKTEEVKYELLDNSIIIGVNQDSNILLLHKKLTKYKVEDGYTVRFEYEGEDKTKISIKTDYIVKVGVKRLAILEKLAEYVRFS